MITLKKVNEALKQLGESAELVRGEGYFYFEGEDTLLMQQTGVYVYRLNELTLDQWISEYNKLKKIV